MSVRVISWVWDHSKSTGADRLVLLAIADAANDAGRDAYPSMTTIARKAGMDKRTAQRSVRALVEMGELAVSDNSGPRGTNRYRVLMKEGRHTTTPRGDTPPADDHPDETPPVATETPGGGISSQQGRRDATRTVLDPSLPVPSETTSRGDRHETLHVVPESEPSLKNGRCTRHPNGNPTNASCNGCRLEREHAERIESKTKQAAIERLKNCPDCHGTGWLEHRDTGLPAGRCTAHDRRTA